MYTIIYTTPSKMYDITKDSLDSGRTSDSMLKLFNLKSFLETFRGIKFNTVGFQQIILGNYQIFLKELFPEGLERGTCTFAINIRQTSPHKQLNYLLTVSKSGSLELTERNPDNDGSLPLGKDARSFFGDALLTSPRFLKKVGNQTNRNAGKVSTILKIAA